MKLAQRMSRLGTETAFEILAKAQKLESQGMDIIHLEIGEPDFPTPENIKDAGKKALDDGYTSYNPSPGFTDLREAIADEISSSRAINATSDNVIVTPGGKPIMFFAIMALIDRGDEVLYPNPGFPIYESMIEYTGAKAVPIELKEDAGFAFDADTVLAQVNENTRLIIINSPANPTGGVVPKATLDRLVEGLEKFPNLVILSDEIYSQMLYDGETHVSLLNYESIRDRLIVIDGGSKTYAMTGWRLGYGVWPTTLFDYAERLAVNSYSCPNAASQHAGIAALTGPQDQVGEMLDAFDTRRKAVVEGLNQIPDITCVMPKGAFYAYPNISATGFNARDLQQGLLEEAGVALVAGTSFGALGEGYLRVSYANSLENVEESISRIAKYLS